jgi:UDP-galactopyranose mutase
MNNRIIIVGAGLTGAVIARELVDKKTEVQIDVYDQRAHIAGNCYEENIDGIRTHKYGPHLFHTNNSKVFDWLSNFTEWIPYKHKVKAKLSDGTLVTLPVNRKTKDIVGESKVIDTFFRPYTKKMWGMEIEQLSPDILKRVPIRDDDNEYYFPNDEFQYMPKEGYTKMIDNILNHERIKVHLGKKMTMERLMNEPHDKAYICAPIDEFLNYRFGELPYRSIIFKTTTVDIPNLFPVATVNFTHNGPSTRVTEWKNIPGHQLQKDASFLTVITSEFPCDYKDNSNKRFYPIKDLSGENRRLYNKYRDFVDATYPDWIFTGRLGKYVYIDMDQCVNMALNEVAKIS